MHSTTSRKYIIQREKAAKSKLGYFTADHDARIIMQPESLSLSLSLCLSLSGKTQKETPPLATKAARGNVYVPAAERSDSALSTRASAADNKSRGALRPQQQQHAMH